MDILKQDGNLDIEKINNLPIEEYMKVIWGMPPEQYKEYLSSLPQPNESQEPYHPIIVDHDFLERNGLVDADTFLEELKVKYGIL